jgi:hypothetical protein
LSISATVSTDLLESLAEHVGQTCFQTRFDFVDDFRVGLIHIGHTLDHFQLLGAGQTRQNFRGFMERQVRDNQRDCLGMFILNKRQKVA